MSITLDTAAAEVMSRLDQGPNTKLWTLSEIKLYLEDAYDEFCGAIPVLFDIAVIPNTAPIGSYGSDLQKYLAQQTVGIRIEENRLRLTQDPEVDLGVEGGYAESSDLPVKAGEGEESS